MFHGDNGSVGFPIPVRISAVKADGVGDGRQSKKRSYLQPSQPSLINEIFGPNCGIF
jgi:hypothetical protein